MILRWERQIRSLGWWDTWLLYDRTRFVWASVAQNRDNTWGAHCWHPVARAWAVLSPFDTPKAARVAAVKHAFDAMQVAALRLLEPR